MKRVLLVALFAPLSALADNDPGQSSSLETWDLGEFCEARDNLGAWAELERRNIFTNRELRSIESERIRFGDLVSISKKKTASR